MPTYTYKDEEGELYEVVQPIRDDPFDHIIKDGVQIPVKRVFHAPGIVLKGRGFFRTGG